jgi:hypothetical protein
VSDRFCCGLYNFEDAEQIREYYYKLDNQKNAYVSDIIFKMLLDGIRFKAVEALSYQDWGTLTDWNNYLCAAQSK